MPNALCIYRHATSEWIWMLGFRPRDGFVTGRASKSSPNSARVDVRWTDSSRGSRSAVHAGRGGTHGQRATCVGVKTVAKTSVPATVQPSRKCDSVRTPRAWVSPPIPGGGRGLNFGRQSYDERKKKIYIYILYSSPTRGSPFHGPPVVPPFSRGGRTRGPSRPRELPKSYGTSERAMEVVAPKSAIEREREKSNLVFDAFPPPSPRKNVARAALHIFLRMCYRGVHSLKQTVVNINAIVDRL